MTRDKVGPFRSGTTKVCVIGDFAVGKTSLVERCVNNVFSDNYLTTVGVKIDTKLVPLGDSGELKMIIWDVAGTDCFGEREFAYLRGCAGLILVADGTRGHTVDTALQLKLEAAARYGEVPIVALINKLDLAVAWEFSDDHEARSKDEGVQWISCSARTGEGVEESFLKLARALS